MKLFLTTLLFFAGNQLASASIIDFEDTTATGWFQHHIQSGDYQFDKIGGYMGVNKYGSWIPVGAYNGTYDIEMGLGLFVLSQLTGEEFNLHSLDAGLGWYNFDGIDDLTVTGYQSNGDVISADLTLTHDYQNFTLSDFSGLNYVTFSGKAINTSYIAIDNIDVSAATVPEPGTLALFSMSLLGLMVTAHKRTCT